MNARMLVLAFLLLPTACLYTNAQVRRTFTLQILHTGGTIIVANQTSRDFEVCDFGTTDRFCASPLSLAPGRSLSLPYRIVTLLPPMPDEPCPVERCVTGDWDARADDELSANTAYVQIQNQQGLVLSIRERSASQANQLVATADFRDGDGCFAVTLAPADDFDPDSEDVLGADGAAVALSTWQQTDCPSDGP